MSTPPGPPPPARQGRLGRWAPPIGKLRPPSNLSDDESRNIEGRRPTGPAAGFGQLWEKSYRARLPVDLTAAEVMSLWKRDFPDFWPPGHRYHRSINGIRAGEVSGIDIPVPGGTRLSTGALVLHTDATSFTLATAQGHMFAGWITFSIEGTPGDLEAQVAIIMRASDPIYEIGLRLGGHKREDWFWSYSLRALGMRFDQRVRVRRNHVLKDAKVRWAAVKNVWYNAWIRTTLAHIWAPFRALYERVRRRFDPSPAAP